MPIEIKELHIKINVDSEAKADYRPPGKDGDKEWMLSECVEQVIEIMAYKKER